MKDRTTAGGQLMASPRILAAALLAISTAFLHPVQAQTRDAVQKELDGSFVIARTNSQLTDLIEAGSVLVLQKDNLLMSEADLLPTGNVYRHGKIEQEGLAVKMSKPSETVLFHPGGKFFVTYIRARSDAVSLELMSDYISVLGAPARRYRASLKFPYPGKTVPSADDVLAQISEVIKIDNPDPQPSAKQPAPVAKPPTISLGMSRDQVIAAFGVPTKIMHQGAKEIDVFPDLKVTFVKGKVADVN